MKDTAVEDSSEPPAPRNAIIQGRVLTWTAEADLESGLAGFIIEVDNKPFHQLPEKPSNPYGRPVFQNLQYSDTPTQPLVEMRFELPESVDASRVRVIAINTAGKSSKPSELAKVVAP